MEFDVPLPSWDDDPIWLINIFQGGGSTTNLFELEVEDWIISIKQLDFMIFNGMFFSGILTSMFFRVAREHGPFKVQ